MRKFTKSATVLAMFLGGAGTVQAQSISRISIQIHMDDIYVTPKDFSLSNMKNVLREEIVKKCAPLKEIKDVDVHVKINRWVEGSDTQSLDIEGSVLCSES